MINNDISKTQEQSGKLETIDYDPTNLFTGKFQRLKNEDKFNQKTHTLIYASIAQKMKFPTKDCFSKCD